MGRAAMVYMRDEGGQRVRIVRPWALAAYALGQLSVLLCELLTVERFRQPLLAPLGALLPLAVAAAALMRVVGGGRPLIGRAARLAARARLAVLGILHLGHQLHQMRNHPVLARERLEVAVARRGDRSQRGHHLLLDDNRDDGRSARPFGVGPVVHARPQLYKRLGELLTAQLGEAVRTCQLVLAQAAPTPRR